jgi:hypothetical protein
MGDPEQDFVAGHALSQQALQSEMQGREPCGMRSERNNQGRRKLKAHTFTHGRELKDQFRRSFPFRSDRRGAPIVVLGALVMRSVFMHRQQSDRLNFPVSSAFSFVKGSFRAAFQELRHPSAGKALRQNSESMLLLSVASETLVLLSAWVLASSIVLSSTEMIVAALPSISGTLMA